MPDTSFIVETVERNQEFENACKKGKVLCTMINKKLAPATFKAIRPFLRNLEGEVMPVDIHNNYYFCMGHHRYLEKVLEKFSGLSAIPVSVY